jgi:uncharacterized cupredoxin-like copper-binding protein
MRAAVPCVAVALVVLSGCGEKRETTTGGASSGGSASAAASVSETEFKLDPSSARASAGSVSVQVKNDGTTQHALVIEAPGGEVKTPTLAPGKSATLKLDLKPGTYEMYCPIDGHKNKGMKGELVVGAGGSGAGTSTDKGGGSSGGGDRSYGGGGY